MRSCLLTLALALAFVSSAGAAGPTPNDPGWPSPAVELVRVPEVWDLTKGDPSVVVGVVDTGVKPSVADVAENLVAGWDFVTNDGGTRDDYGHGTLVASVIAARGDNGTGIAGYCWYCKVMPVRVSDWDNADESTIAAGIRYAVDHGARIVNVSFADEGAGASDGPLATAVSYAQARNVLVVASAGNQGGIVPTYPAAFPGVLSVTGTTADGTALEPWATFGSWVQLAVPGCQIVLASDTYFGEICGTSVAAAAVSGIAALVLSLNPSLSARDLALALRTSARPLTGVTGGVVDAWAAVTALGLATKAAPPAPAGPAQTLPKRTAKVISGTVRGDRTIRAKLAAGRVDVTLDMPDTRGCTLSIVTSSSSRVAIPASRIEIRIGQRVAAGIHKFRISCATKKSRAFSLGIAGFLG